VTAMIALIFPGFACGISHGGINRQISEDLPRRPRLISNTLPYSVADEGGRLHRSHRKRRHEGQRVSLRTSPLVA